jgi:hypothetical protein
MCDQPGAVRQGHWRWLVTGQCQRERTDAQLTEIIREISPVDLELISTLAATLPTRAAIADAHCRRSSSRPDMQRQRQNARPDPSPRWQATRAEPISTTLGVRRREVAVYSCPFARYDQRLCADLGITTT